MPEVGGYTEQPIEGQKFYPQGKMTEIYGHIYVHLCVMCLQQFNCFDTSGLMG